MQSYVAVRQSAVHDLLGVELQRANRLACSGVFGFNGELRDESVDAYG